MYRIPQDIPVKLAVGHRTTQIRVGQFDLQFDFGPVKFMVQSPVKLFRNGTLVATWNEGRWPEPGFYDLMNSVVTRCEVVNDRLIILEVEDGLQVHLEDSSDQYESMSISIEGSPTGTWLI